MSVPDLRIRTVNEADFNPDGDYVLYWMIAYRRTGWNFSLQRAIEWANDLKKPLLVLEALRCDYPWASDRIHRFVIEGMADNAKVFAQTPAGYYPYLEPAAKAGKGLLAKLAKQACVVVSDDYPCCFVPRMVASASEQSTVRMELVDSNGLLPLRAADKTFARAVDFRRFLQRSLRKHLDAFPEPDPLAHATFPKLIQLPSVATEKWSPANPEKLLAEDDSLAKFPIDHSIAPTTIKGGSSEGKKVIQRFIDERLERYADDRNQPDQEVSSGLSPYLRHGHVAAHQVFQGVAEHCEWSSAQLALKASGQREGWWGAPSPAEAFFDELITWRELGFNMCSRSDEYDQYHSLPEWARQTLADHEDDPREHSYSLDEFAAAKTHDEIWNAAQRQLLRQGRIHNYLRMLWGKKILEWTESPQQALEFMVELNNKYALDGRDPNSYSGIFWVLGRYDRAWGPERPIYGKIRYMSSENTARKLRLDKYLKKFNG